MALSGTQLRRLARAITVGIVYDRKAPGQIRRAQLKRRRERDKLDDAIWGRTHGIIKRQL